MTKRPNDYQKVMQEWLATKPSREAMEIARGKLIYQRNNNLSGDMSADISNALLLLDIAIDVYDKKLNNEQ